MPFPAFAACATAIVLAAMAATLLIRRRDVAAGVAIAGAMAVAAINAAGYMRYYSDDAYITLRYSRNFADGNGPVWNPGEHVEGYTSFLWMALLAGVHRLGFDLVDASVALAYVALLATLLIVWRIWALWADEAAEPVTHPAVIGVIVLFIALNDSVVYWGFSGLETALAGALLSLTAYLYLRESRGARYPASALAAAAAAMTRPEMLLIAAVTGAFTGRDALTTREPRNVRRAAAWFATFAVTFGSYYVWRYAYYGHHVFPNTFYAKVGSDVAFLNRGMGYVQAYAMSYLFLPFLLGVLALAAAAPPKMRRDSVYLLAVIGAWLAAVMVEGGDAFFHGRFIAPVVPLVYVAGISGLTLILSRAIPEPRNFAAVGLTAALLSGMALMRSSAHPTLPTERHAHDDRVALGRWVRANVREDFTIATFASGAVPYFAQTRALDMFGLTDETISHTVVPDFGDGIAGHEKYNVPYVLDRVRPELILLGDSYPFVLPREDLAEISRGTPAYAALIADPRTFDLYEAGGVEYEGRYFPVLVRRDVVSQVRLDWLESQGLIRR